MEYDVLYNSEDFTVLLPVYLSDSVSYTSEVGKNESENGEDPERSEDACDSSSISLDDVYTTEYQISEQIEVLNNNVCTMNDNLITLNNNVLYLIGVSALALFFILVNFAIRIFNNTLGLGKV